jgi:thiosulfate/3-mercaptopyruvate sulfurtransferase
MFKDSSPTCVVSPQWLAEHGTSSLVLIIDCRFSLAEPELGYRHYQEGHIPGAAYLDLNRDLSSQVGKHGGRHPLPEPANLAARFNQLGMTESTLVVAYDDSRFAFAARLWWLLRWLGHDQVAVLDGGLAAYRAAGYPLTTETPPARPGNWQPRPRAEWVVDIETVKARQHQPGMVLIDAREPARYRGEQEPIDPIAGHIPGALNYPWQAITDAQGQLRLTADLQAHWAEICEAEEIVVYCGSGVTACVDLLGLAAAGITGAKLYAGSWSDWCSYQ